jgi:hypothetical protein
MAEEVTATLLIEGVEAAARRALRVPSTASRTTTSTSVEKVAFEATWASPSHPIVIEKDGLVGG